MASVVAVTMKKNNQRKGLQSEQFQVVRMHIALLGSTSKETVYFFKKNNTITQHQNRDNAGQVLAPPQMLVFSMSAMRFQTL